MSRVESGYRGEGGSVWCWQSECALLCVACAVCLSVCVQERVLVAKRLQKERLMRNFWSMVYQPHVSLFPLMRLLLPQLDSDRSTYGLRESSLGDVYIQALGLSKTLDQAMRLKSYKTPHRAGAGGGGHASAGSVSGDFSLVLADVLRKYVSVGEGQSKLTIADVNGLLDQLAQEREKGSAARAGVFMRLVTELSPKENMWFRSRSPHSATRMLAARRCGPIVNRGTDSFCLFAGLWSLSRIILKDLKIGMKHESMLKLFDSDALDMYNACSSLKYVCEQVAEPTRKKAAFEQVQYFQACKPMLASSPAWDQVVAKMKGHSFFIEDKYDGERIIIHKKGGEVKLFTRKSIDYTNRYGYGSTFTPVVMQALPKDCIVDGEMVTFDTATGQYLKFGSNRTIALAGVGATGGDTKQLCYIAFDILKVDNHLLVNRTLKQRREILKTLVVSQPRKFEVIEHRTDVTTSQGLLAALTEATGMGKEGIIVKDSTAPYVLNDRSDWVRKHARSHSSGEEWRWCRSSLSLSCLFLVSVCVCSPVDQSEARLRGRSSGQHGSDSDGRILRRRNAAIRRHIALPPGTAGAASEQ